MSSLHRKPLLRFETSERAQLISSSMPSSNKRKRRSGKRSVASTSGKKPRVVKGRVNLRVAGYSGLQKIAPSALIPFLPANKIKQAAKRVLGASGKQRKRKTTVRRRKRTKKGKRRN